MFLVFSESGRPLLVPLRDPVHDPTWDACGHHVLRNVTGDHAAGTDDGVGADGDAGKDSGVGADPDVVPDADRSVSKKPRMPLTKEQIALVRSTWSEHRMGIPALIMLYCGLRRGELIALTWRDVDLKKKVLVICKAATTTSNQHKLKDPKTAAGHRMVPIPDFLADILAKQPRESLMVCPAVTGAMMSAQAWERAWESYMHFLNIKAGGRDRSRINPKVVAMEPFTPHQLRHTYASLLYDAGVDAKSAQEMMGHSNIQTTLEIYTHLSREKKTTAISVINDYLQKLDDGGEMIQGETVSLPSRENQFEAKSTK